MTKSLVVLFSFLWMTYAVTAEAATISGTVYQSDGVTPITGDANIEVHVYEHQYWDNPIIKSSLNTTDGTFIIQDLDSNNEYDIRVIAKNYIDEYWASPSSVYYRHLSQPIILAVDENRAGVDFQLEPGTVVSGTVYKTDGTTPLVTGVCAFEGESCGEMWDFCTTSTVDGTFSVRVPEGTFFLDAGSPYIDPFLMWSSGNYILEWWAEGASVRDCAEASQIVVSAGTPISEINFQLEEGVEISGTIYMSDGVTPITGDRGITAFVIRENPCEPQGAAFSLPMDSDGTYSLLVEPGTYYLGITAENYVDEWWHEGSSVYSCSQAREISAQLGVPVTDHDFQLDEGAVITGTVFKQDNSTPFIEQNCLYIDIVSQDPCEFTQRDFTTFVDPADAEYSIHVPDGTYYLMANTCDWFTSEWWKEPSSVSTDYCEQAQSLSVISGSTYPDKNFQIGSEKSGALTGVIQLLLLRKK